MMISQATASSIVLAVEALIMEVNKFTKAIFPMMNAKEFIQMRPSRVRF